MSLELFVISLVLTLGTVGVALLYPRGITRRAVVDQCRTDADADADADAEFWLRAAALRLPRVHGPVLDWLPAFSCWP